MKPCSAYILRAEPRSNGPRCAECLYLQFSRVLAQAMMKTIHRFFGASLISLLAACGSSTDPNNSPTVPALGQYSVTINLATGNPSYQIPTSGTFVLTYATSDSIAGYMEGSDYRAAISGGEYNIDAYRITFQTTDGYLVIVRLAPTHGSLTCQEALSWTTGQSLPDPVCTVTYAGD